MKRILQISFRTMLPILRVAVLLPVISASAAEISLMPEPINGIYAVIIKGKIEKGDAREFEVLTEGKKRVFVGLSSPGGSVPEALKIGARIRTEGYATSVADVCASSCGFIWLSGASRYLNIGAKVGFHAAYDLRTGQEDGMSNAEIGSFLTSLGLGIDAIRFITIAPPNEIRWLTYEDAARLGIDIVPPKNAKVTSQRKPEPPAYINKPAPKDADRESLLISALVASKLVLTSKCSAYYQVNQEKIRALHAELMKVSPKDRDKFIDYLEDELRARAHEIRRDGLKRFCDNARREFQDVGVRDIFLN